MNKELTREEEYEWLEGLKKFDEQNRNIILAVFSVFGVPQSYLDIGCGSGIMVRTARDLGVQAFGVDQIHHPEVYFFQHNLAAPFGDLRSQCDLVTSLEVAEHIEESGADVFCDTITEYLVPHGLLIFTAAMPGQPGHNHLNCQPAEYWRKKFYDRGLNYDAARTYRLALAWSITYMSQHHLEANLQIFEK